MSVASTDEQSLEARTLRKVIIRAVPFLMALYFVNYLDRTNLGIAKADISEHLQLTSTMFGLASGIFFSATSWSRCRPTSLWSGPAPGAGWPGSRCRGESSW